MPHRRETPTRFPQNAFSACRVSLSYHKSRRRCNISLSIPIIILIALITCTFINDIAPCLRAIFNVICDAVVYIVMMVPILASTWRGDQGSVLRGSVPHSWKLTTLRHTNQSVIAPSWTPSLKALPQPPHDITPHLSFFAEASGIMPQKENNSLISSYFYLLNIRNGFTNEFIFPTRLSLRNLLLNILQIQKPDGNKRRSSTRSALVRKSLLVITTKNLLHITKLTFYSLRLHRELPDILVVDDCSMENVVDDLHASFGKDLPIVGYITKKQAKGLTDSWNRAYKWFKERSQYEFLIMSNNDVLIPEGALTWIIRCLAAGFPLCKPLGTATGVGDRPNQDVWRVLRGIVSNDYLHRPENYIKIQRLLEARRDLVPFWRDNFPFNGFFFAVRRDAMARAEFDPDNDLLFDPKCVNVKNEDDLTRRIGKSFHALCQKCFVLHFKNLTIQKGEKKGKEEKIVGDWRELLVTDAGHYTQTHQASTQSKVERLGASVRKRIEEKAARKRDRERSGAGEAVVTVAGNVEKNERVERDLL